MRTPCDTVLRKVDPTGLASWYPTGVSCAKGIGRRLRGDFDSNYKCALLRSQVKPPISQLKLQIPKYDSSDHIRQVGPIILIQASSPIGGDNVI